MEPRKLSASQRKFTRRWRFWDVVKRHAVKRNRHYLDKRERGNAKWWSDMYLLAGDMQQVPSRAMRDQLRKAYPTQWRWLVKQYAIWLSVS